MLLIFIGYINSNKIAKCLAMDCTNEVPVQEREGFLISLLQCPHNMWGSPSRRSLKLATYSYLQPTSSCHLAAILPCDMEALFLLIFLHLTDPHACLIMIYLITLSPSQNIQHRMIGCLVNTKLERMWYSPKLEYTKL
jgi:hypothetical protein